MSTTKDIFGYLGGTMLVLTMVPQVYHTYKTRKIRDLSIFFILFEIVTSIIFLVYGALLVEFPLLIANSIVIFQLMMLLYAKFKFVENKIIPNISQYTVTNGNPPEYISTI